MPKKEAKIVTWNLKEKDKKWLEVQLAKKKKDDKFFAACWKRRDEIKADWERREKAEAAKAKKKAGE